MTADHVTRRQAMAGAAAVGFAAATAHAAGTGETIATGRVLADTGADRTPLAGIMVSNGRDVVLTDAGGRYALPITPGDSVFVIKPPGHALPLDPVTRLPVFAYLHEPDGSPAGFRYAGIAPTGTLPENIDFVLRPAAEPAAFQVLLFTDPQPESLAELGYIRDDVVATALTDAALADTDAPTLFGIAHGDLMFDDLSLYTRYNRILATTGLPWHSLPGNHDINVEAPDNVHSRDTFKRVFGARRHTLQAGGATFLLLDNVEYLGPDPARPGQLGTYQGRFGPEQLGFVRAVLAHVPTDALVVISFHIPLRTAVGHDPATATVDVSDFLAAISTHPNSISFAGHTHTNEHHYLGAADGFSGGTHHHHVLAAASGSWWSGPLDVRGIPVALQSDGCPNGYHLLRIDGAAATTRFIPAHDSARGQMRIMFDSQAHRDAPELLGEYPPGALLAGAIPLDAVASTRVLVNLFDGGPRSELGLAIDGAAPLTMRRVERTDPYVEEVYARNAATKKPWVKPTRSTHLWELSLPPGLAAGIHRITVTARDEYGRDHVGDAVLEVT